MSDSEDRQLIERVIAGDVDAYGGIVHRYQERLYWVGYRLLGNHEDARDLTQETLLRIYHNLAKFDTSRRLYTWAYRILANLAIDRMRSRERLGRRPLPDDVEDRGAPPDQRLIGEELRDEVRETLLELPPRYRALLVLRDVEGLTGKDISDSSGVGHATVRWRIHRARKLFREAWERRRARKGEER